MSLNSKQQRAKERKKARDAKKALYVMQSRERKSRKDSDAIASFNPWKHAHRVHNCGNVGCRHCGHGA